MYPQQADVRSEALNGQGQRCLPTCTLQERRTVLGDHRSVLRWSGEFRPLRDERVAGTAAVRVAVRNESGYGETVRRQKLECREDFLSPVSSARVGGRA